MEAKGLINIYECFNRHQIITKNLDDGVTPMFKRCEKCGADMVSKMYRVPQGLTPTHYWYKPTPEQFKKLSKPMQQHVKMGGLDFRKADE